MQRFSRYFLLDFLSRLASSYIIRYDQFKFLNRVIFAWLFLILLNNSNAQKLDVHQFYLAKGNGLSKSASSDQIMIMQKIFTVYKFNETFTLENNIVYELISETGRTNYLIGALPLIKMRFYLIQRKFIFFGGSGINYISTERLAGRNLGGRFIFSNLVGIGINVYSFYDYEIDISYVFRHISNAGFYEHNEGFNSQYLMISLRL